MRHNSTGRGAHYNHANQFRLWTFDEAAAADDVQEVVGSDHLVEVGLPAVDRGWVGGFRRTAVGVTLIGAGVGTDAARMTATTWTCGWSGRLLSLPAGTVSLFGYTAPNDATSNSNNLLDVRVDAAGFVVLHWQSGVNVDRNVTTSYRLPVGKHVDMWLVRRASTVIVLFINGARVAEFSLVVANVGGSLCKWRVGTTEAGAASTISADVCSLWASTTALASTTSLAECARSWRRAQGFEFSNYVQGKVLLQDGNSVMRDMSDIEGHDFLEGVSGGWSVDDAVEVCKLELTREIEQLSLATFNDRSPLNLPLLPVLTVLPFIDQGRDVEVYFARVPMFLGPEATDYVLRFKGQSDEPDWGSNPITLQCRDEANYLVDDVMENDVKLPLAGSLGTGGCSATEAPLETMISNLLTLVHEGTYSLHTPTAANLCMLQQEIERGSIMEKARDLASVKGWDTKMFFDQAPTQNKFRFTLLDPKRTRTDSDGVLTRKEIGSLSRVGYSRIDVRNRIRGSALTTSADAEGVNQDDTGVIVPVVVEDATSQTKYKKRFMDITMDSTSFIRGKANLTAMLNTVLSDLKDPTVEASLQASDLFELELFDFVALHNARPWAVAQNAHNVESVALTSCEWDYKAGEGLQVSGGLRGAPTIGAVRHLRNDARSGMGERRRTPVAAWAQLNHGKLMADRLSPVRAMLESSQVLRSGRFLSIPNGDFSTWTGGDLNPPDGWEASGGVVWNTHMFIERTVVRTGNRAVRVTGNVGSLRSGRIPVEELTPYSFEVDWWRTGGDELFDLTIESLSAAGAVLATNVHYPGLAASFPAVSAQTLVWFTSRLQGISFVANTRFIRLTFRGRVISAFTPIVIDRVQMLRSRYEAKAFCISGAPTWGNSGSVKTFKHNVSFTDVATAGAFDRGGLLQVDTGTFTAQTFAAAVTDICTYAADLPSFTQVRLITTGTLPAGLALLTSYWTTRLSATTCKLSTSLANALAGVFVDITGIGTGVHTMTVYARRGVHYLIKESGTYDIHTKCHVQQAVSVSSARRWVVEVRLDTDYISTGVPVGGSVIGEDRRAATFLLDPWTETIAGTVAEVNLPGVYLEKGQTVSVVLFSEANTAGSDERLYVDDGPATNRSFFSIKQKLAE